MTDPKTQETVIEFAGVTLRFGGKVAVQDGVLLGQAGDGRRVPGKLAAAIQDGPTV